MNIFSLSQSEYKNFTIITLYFRQRPFDNRCKTESKHCKIKNKFAPLRNLENIYAKYHEKTIRKFYIHILLRFYNFEYRKCEHNNQKMCFNEISSLKTT